MTEARIHDRGYLAYDGPRHGPGHAMVVLGYHTVQRVLGLKRSNWQKVMPAITLLIAFVPAIVFIGLAALLPDSSDLDLGDPTGYYWLIVWMVFLFTSFVTPEAICTDRRSGLLGLYLASPLSRDTYLAAKLAAIVTVLGIMTIGPTLLMLIAFTLEGSGPDGVIDWLTELGRVLASGLAMAAFWGALSLAVSSFTTRRALASVAIFVSLLVSAAVGDGLAEGAEVGDSFALLNMITLPLETVYRIYGETNTDGPPIGEVGTLLVLFTHIGLIVAFGAFARWRYQRIEVTG
ncbi:MAG: ABC transporter permease subunit [bacterium]|nr:ABC transporter permease subunit [bacterium]MXZ76701.1 ABC transporter permease subunit [Acidimicrobiia bacterium]MXZ86953.1 ABC transporter permease subunit [Acidimicrobiia bacterium]MYE72328.1 ABC transporter permease subunit [Acidimicrobiia bacterium]MYG72353.1 ABC transporter permease subunit [Acidimicrobiia bacterium]